jgi:hypothetical protein
MGMERRCFKNTEAAKSKRQARRHGQAIHKYLVSRISIQESFHDLEVWAAERSPQMQKEKMKGAIFSDVE